MSEPQMPQWPTSTSTCPGPGRGTGRSSMVTSPLAVYTAAGMVSGSDSASGNAWVSVTGPPCRGCGRFERNDSAVASTMSGGPLEVIWPRSSTITWSARARA